MNRFRNRPVAVSKRQEGFTLIELVVATALFSLFMVGVVGSFAAIMKVHQHSIVVRDSQANGRIVLEDIARLARNASEACISYSGGICAKGSGSTLVLDNYSTFLLSNGQIVLRRANMPDRALTDGEKLSVSELSFTVPEAPVGMVQFGFTINARSAAGVGAAWQINGGSGIRLGSTVALRNGGAR